MPYHPTPLHAIAATIVMTTGQRDILHAAGNEFAALRAQNARLRGALENIWKCAAHDPCTNQEARGWIEVEARVALAAGER